LPRKPRRDKTELSSAEAEGAGISKSDLFGPSLVTAISLEFRFQSADRSFDDVGASSGTGRSGPQG
jgi:hypothetical protein